jgi:hypothetical protein
MRERESKGMERRMGSLVLACSTSPGCSRGEWGGEEEGRRRAAHDSLVESGANGIRKVLAGDLHERGLLWVCSRERGLE